MAKGRVIDEKDASYTGLTCTSCDCDVNPTEEELYGEWCAECFAREWHKCETCGEHHHKADLDDDLACPDLPA